jgi:hypothetical protein
MWPFGRKKKPEPARMQLPIADSAVPAMPAQPPPPPEKEPEPAPTWEERIQKAAVERGLLLAAEMEELIRLEPDNCDYNQVVACLRPVFEGATNNDACPCHGPSRYERCCKPRWKGVQRLHQDQIREQRQAREAEAAEKAKARDEERTRENVTWMVRIGQDAKGHFLMDPLDDTKRFSIREVCDALELCAWQAREMVLSESIKNQVLSVLMRAAQRQAQADKK